MYFHEGRVADFLQPAGGAIEGSGGWWCSVRACTALIFLTKQCSSVLRSMQERRDKRADIGGRFSSRTGLRGAIVGGCSESGLWEFRFIALSQEMGELESPMPHLFGLTWPGLLCEECLQRSHAGSSMRSYKQSLSLTSSFRPQVALSRPSRRSVQKNMDILHDMMCWSQLAATDCGVHV